MTDPQEAATWLRAALEITDADLVSQAAVDAGRSTDLDSARDALRRLLAGVETLPVLQPPQPGCGCPDVEGPGWFGAHHRVLEDNLVHWFDGTAWKGFAPDAPLDPRELRALVRRARDRADCEECPPVEYLRSPAVGSVVVESHVGVRDALKGTWTGLGVYLGNALVQTMSREEWDRCQAEYMPGHRAPYAGSGEPRHAIWTLDGAAVVTWSNCSFWTVPTGGAQGLCSH